MSHAAASPDRATPASSGVPTPRRTFVPAASQAWQRCPRELPAPRVPQPLWWSLIPHSFRQVSLRQAPSPPLSAAAPGPNCFRSRRPPSRPVAPSHLDGRGDLRLVDQVVRVAEHEQRGLQLPRLEVVHLGKPRVEVPEGGEELGGVHEHTSQSQPSLWPFARISMRAPRSEKPCRTSSRMRCSCSTVANSPGARCSETGSAEPSEPSEPCSHRVSSRDKS